MPVQSRTERLSENPYASVDPAPPADEPSQLSCAQLRATLLDDTVPLFERYRAMFSLRNRGDAESVTALADGRRIARTGEGRGPGKGAMRTGHRLIGKQDGACVLGDF